MTYRLHELLLPLDYKEEHVIKAAAIKIGCHSNDIKNFTIVRRSIDARKKPVFTFTVEFSLDKTVKLKNPEFLKEKKVEKVKKEVFVSGKKGNSDFHPVVIGAGPAGLMAALMLAKSGLSPVLLERGGDVNSRSQVVKNFWQNGILDKNNNVLYGEGGAGLYSDGKLTSRSKDRPAVRFFMETLVACGAPQSIMYDAEPHLGSDLLKEIVPKLRKMIIDNGGEVRFNAVVENIIVEKGKVTGVMVNGNIIKTDTCILATGHSARDVFRFLAKSGVSLETKSFAVGLRMELPQRIVDETQWGKYAGHPRLGAASFRLTRKPENKYRACYTFCMCPGGIVIPCASEEGMFTTNGMSLHSRDLPYANAAFLVPVTPDDYKSYQASDFPELAGFNFQQEIEKNVFIAGGENYSVPVSSLFAFLKKKKKITRTKNISFNRTRNVNLHTILPKFISDTLIYSIPKMVKVFKNLDFKEVTLYGVETRSSSPVRIKRGEDGQSVNTKGLYPCGEGAGYAGGIVSSALDGLKIAKFIIEQ